VQRLDVETKTKILEVNQKASANQSKVRAQLPGPPPPPPRLSPSLLTTPTASHPSESSCVRLPRLRSTSVGTGCTARRQAFPISSGG
jgi:hypothetical protein